MSNYSTLSQNTLAGFGEFAGALYLDLLDKYQGHSNATNERKAFWEADSYEKGVGGFIEYVLDNNPAHNLDAKTKTALSHFFAARWRNNFMEQSS